MVGLVSSDRIKPGEDAQITVTLDPAGKVGPTTKKVTIASNDPERPAVTVRISANVDHTLDLVPGEPIEDVLFGRADCARCHADRGKGMTGVPLYRALCAMCHGMLEEYAPSLPEAIRNRAALRGWVADGKGERGMPGYSLDNGGPLTDEQIDTLVESMLDAKSLPR